MTFGAWSRSLSSGGLRCQGNLAVVFYLLWLPFGIIFIVYMSRHVCLILLRTRLATPWGNPLKSKGMGRQSGKHQSDHWPR